jgi:solute:Na+ symporter, SSS family
MFTRSRGNDTGNLLAMAAGFIAVLCFSVNEIQQSLGIARPFIIAFPWRITLGTLVTVMVAMCFATPKGKNRTENQSPD